MFVLGGYETFRRIPVHRILYPLSKTISRLLPVRCHDKVMSGWWPHCLGTEWALVLFKSNARHVRGTAKGISGMTVEPRAVWILFRFRFRWAAFSKHRTPSNFNSTVSPLGWRSVMWRTKGIAKHNHQYKATKMLPSLRVSEAKSCDRTPCLSALNASSAGKTTLGWSRTGFIFRSYLVPLSCSFSRTYHDKIYRSWL